MRALEIAAFVAAFANCYPRSATVKPPQSTSVRKKSVPRPFVYLIFALLSRGEGWTSRSKERQGQTMQWPAQYQGFGVSTVARRLRPRVGWWALSTPACAHGSRLIDPACTTISCARAVSRNNSRQRLPTSPPGTGWRYFVAHTKWYLQSHTAWPPRLYDSIGPFYLASAAIPAA